MKTFIITTVIVLFLAYMICGTGEKVDKIREIVEHSDVMAQRGWTIMRYEGYQWGAFDHHGGKVYYHVANIDNPNIQYRIYVCLWGNELQWYYDQPERLVRIE